MCICSIKVGDTVQHLKYSLDEHANLPLSIRDISGIHASYTISHNSMLHEETLKLGLAIHLIPDVGSHA